MVMSYTTFLLHPIILLLGMYIRIDLYVKNNVFRDVDVWMALTSQRDLLILHVEFGQKKVFKEVFQ